MDQKILNKKIHNRFSIVIAILIVSGTVNNSFADSPALPTHGTFEFDGAGATFPYPLIDLWKTKYEEEFDRVKFSYKSIGSGGGIKEHTEKRVHFGASDAPLTEKEAERAKGTLIIPETLGAVTISYNIPGIPSGLKLTGMTIADIYLGKITSWNHPEIAELNPGITLPEKAITAVRRSDSSGTTYVFTDYLSSVSEEWKTRYGAAKSVEWPRAVGSPGNDGVANYVASVPYSLGYVELSYAIENKMSYADVQNADGTKFVTPSISSTKSAAEASVINLPMPDENWYGVSIVSQPGENSYPITSFSYILVYNDLSILSNMDIDKSKALLHLLHWMITDGQKYSTDLHYVPIPPEVQELGIRGLSQIKYDGQQIWQGSSDAENAGTKSAIKTSARLYLEGILDESNFLNEMSVNYRISDEDLEQNKLPKWAKTNVQLWLDGKISEDEFVRGIKYLLKNDL